MAPSRSATSSPPVRVVNANRFVDCVRTIYTVRHGGQPAGRARQGPPTRRCQAIAPTTRRTGVARPLRGGSARSSHAAISSTARAATSPFRRGSCRARCASVHDRPSPLAPTIGRLVPSRARQMGTERRSRLEQAVRSGLLSCLLFAEHIITGKIHHCYGIRQKTTVYLVI